MKQRDEVDIAIVGAGAAGLVAAIATGRMAAERKRSFQILLLNALPEIGAKIRLSGGSRCNITNRNVTPADYESGSRPFVKHVLAAFTVSQTIAFFREIGVPFVLEPGGKYFPTTHSGRMVVEALQKEIQRLGIRLQTGVHLTRIQKTNDLFCLQTADGGYSVSARKVILTTGGLSYPRTGCDGTGYRIAESFGHTVVNPCPALTPFQTDDADWKKLSGLALETKLFFFKSGKKQAECRGPLLFTHSGFSGPVVLDISRHFAKAKAEECPQIQVSFLPDETEESLKTGWEKTCKKTPRKLIKHFLKGDLRFPNRFTEIFLRKAGCGELEPMGQCAGERRRKLLNLLLHYPLEVSGVRGFEEAEVTAGGVDVKEVNAMTMESKLIPGLYFAGEMLDVDGRIGGFNFQWAWSSGQAAGESAAKSVMP